MCLLVCSTGVIFFLGLFKSDLLKPAIIFLQPAFKQQTDESLVDGGQGFINTGEGTMEKKLSGILLILHSFVSCLCISMYAFCILGVSNFVVLMKSNIYN